MNDNYKFEIDSEIAENKCHCCDNTSMSKHGFIYKNGAPYAVFYAAWSKAHTVKMITFALAIGEWDDDSTNLDRTSFGINVLSDESGIHLNFISPESSPWPSTELLGKMLCKSDSISHPMAKEVTHLVESLLAKDASISEYLK